MAVRSMKTQDDIRRALAHTYRELEADKIDPTKARTLVYCALSLSQVIGEHDIETRLAKLEAEMKSGKRFRGAA